jgi:catechol 2,3-dioxygenase-like lactoylglutathione lyase family enzyme
MIEGINAVTLGTHEMPRAVRFYRTLGFEVLHGGEDSSFTSFRAGTSYLNLITQPTERRWSWWGAGNLLHFFVGVKLLLRHEHLSSPAANSYQNQLNRHASRTNLRGG